MALCGGRGQYAEGGNGVWHSNLTDEFVGIDGAMATRRVRYRDPETGTRYEFPESEDDFPPGLIALLYPP
jgi:hypothetical protein